eukprot:1851527-Pleurochrysis_carterae.AAC.1
MYTHMLEGGRVRGGASSHRRCYFASRRRRWFSRNNAPNSPTCQTVPVHASVSSEPDACACHLARAQVQLLSHQYKIASRVELFIGRLPQGAAMPPSGAPNVVFERLGHFSLDVNERSNWQARELKTVYVPQASEGHFLKLLLHKCHVNEHNL